MKKIFSVEPRGKKKEMGKNLLKDGERLESQKDPVDTITSLEKNSTLKDKENLAYGKPWRQRKP